MIYIDEENDPAMIYEKLASAVFDNCERGNDPFSYTRQDLYTNFINPNLRGKRALSTIVIKMILDNPKHKLLERMKELDNEIWDSDSQEKIKNIIKNMIFIANELNYGY